ncbi:MAG: 4'-phosphopantetheinyl transferase superfamily protein [Clostridia bacterium]|nr:4'-phosphopantetheinyl transferase superfamily protein [Clostridia bacterium]
MKAYGRILSLDTLPKDRQSLEELIQQLPFGKEEADRILSRKHLPSVTQSLAAHLALSHLLEEQKLTPGNIRRTSSGKPYFTESPSLPFSLSHAGSLAVAAIATDGTEIGVDLELFRPRRKTASLIARYFSPAQQRQWAESSDPDWEFLRLWTEKEAIAKCGGEGLAALLKQRNEAEYFLSTYTVRYGKEWGIVSLCAQVPITQIQWFIDEKEITIHEIQNRA